MAEVWVKAKVVIYQEVNGEVKTTYPGCWTQMRRQQAREYLARQQIEILKPAVLQSVQDLPDCSIYLKGTVNESWRQRLEARYPGVAIEEWRGIPSSGRFLLWDMDAALNQELILVGFGLLQEWQLAVPLKDYDTLAQDIGSTEEQAETKAIIHDLRVPVYNPRVIFARSCQETKRLFELWQDGSELGFLRTLYQARPMVNALPPSWVM